MPVSYEIRDVVLRLNLEGEYEPEEILRTFLAAMSDPACPKPVALLVDVSRSESLSKRSPGEIQTVAQALGPFAKRIGGRCAVVATDDLHFGLTRMGSAYSGGVGVDVQVFREMDAALGWLASGA
ncbi:MAG TPA: hypothetical protein VFS09_06380, partial [Candidatus Eisenbacteria bacterium]|nr:hypothetical protein [Candidatus Eisenbacteria bacterium]